MKNLEKIGINPEEIDRINRTEDEKMRDEQIRLLLIYDDRHEYVD